MESMLALLPPGEPESMLFKAHFLNRLPADICNHVAAAGFNNTASEMADIADAPVVCFQQPPGRQQVQSGGGSSSGG